MADYPLEEQWDVVSWALSGNYDEDRPVLIDASNPGRSLSKRKVTELIARLAGSFEPGSTVCVHLYNDILYPVLVLAILASGCEWTGTNPAYTSGELAHHFTQSDARYVITDRHYVQVVESAISSSGRDLRVVLFTDLASDKPPTERCNGTNGHEKIGHETNGHEVNGIVHTTLHDLLTHGTELTLQQRLLDISCHSPATIMSTSGTTGLPKMVQRSHQSLVVETSGIEDSNNKKPYSIRRLYCTPMFHAFSFPEMVINTLRLGFPSFYMRRFDETFANKVQEFDITETMAAPAMLLKIVEQTEKDETAKSSLQSLRMVLCAGASLPSQLRSRFLGLFAHNSTRLVQVWGMSEGGWFTTFRYPEHDDTGSVGRPHPDYQVCVREDCRVKLVEGRRAGELMVRGLQRTTVYKGNADATRESFRDGWLRTGDIGYKENGKVYLIDRAKDIIKVNGWTVSPAELEAVLYQMPGVLDAAALSNGLGTDEHAVIFVVPREHTLTKIDVMQHLLDRVARFKVATCKIHFVASLPRNTSGKIQRGVLKRRLEIGN